MAEALLALAQGDLGALALGDVARHRGDARRVARARVLDEEQVPAHLGRRAGLEIAEAEVALPTGRRA